jgi:site-specific DNA-methyltransferase (adenine-specific)
MSNINLYLGCSLEAMKAMPDKCYDLAIVDPPYGVGNFTQSDRKKKYGDYKWNGSTPGEDYFNELFRVSKNWIIWGANYYNCFSTGGAVIWDKENPHPSMSRCEIAAISLQKKVDYIRVPHYGFVGEHDNFHPCGKPVKLYKKLLKNYAKEGDKILDTHGGSMSIALACHDMGFDLDLWEIDADYYAAGVKRFNNHKAQLGLFTNITMPCPDTENNQLI